MEGFLELSVCVRGINFSFYVNRNFYVEIEKENGEGVIEGKRLGDFKNGMIYSVIERVYLILGYINRDIILWIKEVLVLFYLDSLF